LYGGGGGGGGEVDFEAQFMRGFASDNNNQ
jgi:hypothetical protein